MWGEHASWGLDISGPIGLERFLPEWLEAVKRILIILPLLVGAFNETSREQDDEVLRIVYQVTKMLDNTRPVIDTSGYIHVVTILRIYMIMNGSEIFKQRYEPLKEGKGIVADHLGGLIYSKNYALSANTAVSGGA